MFLCWLLLVFPLLVSLRLVCHGGMLLLPIQPVLSGCWKSTAVTAGSHSASSLRVLKIHSCHSGFPGDAHASLADGFSICNTCSSASFNPSHPTVLQPPLTPLLFDFLHKVMCKVKSESDFSCYLMTFVSFVHLIPAVGGLGVKVSRRCNCHSPSSVHCNRQNRPCCLCCSLTWRFSWSWLRSLASRMLIGNYI